MKYRIKEYTDKYGSRKFQVQEKKWWGWKDCDRYHETCKGRLPEAEALIRWMIASEQEEAKNKAKKTEYHYVE